MLGVAAERFAAPRQAANKCKKVRLVFWAADRLRVDGSVPDASGSFWSLQVARPLGCLDHGKETVQTVKSTKHQRSSQQ